MTREEASKKLEAMRRTLKQWSHEYYVLDNPTATDYEYDELGNLLSESTRDRASEEVAVISESSFLPKGASQDMRFYDISGIGSCKLKNASDASAWITLSGKALAFYVLEEKTVDHTEHTGSLTRISADNRFALLSTCSKLKPFQNLMLRIGGRDTYAKIVSQEGNEFRLCFTSVPENFLDLVKML